MQRSDHCHAQIRWLQEVGYRLLLAMMSAQLITGLIISLDQFNNLEDEGQEMVIPTTTDETEESIVSVAHSSIHYSKGNHDSSAL